MIYEYTRTQAAPRYERGCDYGAEGKVLIRHGKRKLVWRPGHTGWQGRGVQGYYPAFLHVVNPAGDRMLHSVRIGEDGGRLSMKRIVESLDRIRELLDLPALDAGDILSLTSTLIVHDGAELPTTTDKED